jgi:uridine monophosphate synthetase
MDQKKEFFLEAYKLGIIKFGRFTLKSGVESPFYVDLRPLSSDPKILKELANYLLQIVPIDNFDLICGVPYAALPMATAMSLQSYIPLIIKRKEAKAYGTKKLLEGIFTKGQNCILVEDVITSGKSLLETIEEVENEGLKVTDILVVLDREQGGSEILRQKGYNVHCLFTISEVIKILQEVDHLSDEEVAEIQNFIKGHPVNFVEKKRLPYEEKIKLNGHEVSQKLINIALQKKSNLIASADVNTMADLLKLADEIGPNIVALKTHIDIISDFDLARIQELKDLAKKHNFLIFEDRKFADIGNTQELQFTQGVYKIATWADMITTHVIGGSQALDAFTNVGVVSILSMSSKGCLTDAHYQTEALQVIENHPNAIGCVAQNSLANDALLLFTPGVNLESTGDAKGQQYNTPAKVFKNYHTDFIIVGRGIYKAQDPKSAAQTYQKAGWEAYLESL